MKEKPSIKIINGNKTFSDKMILENANVEFNSGEITAIIAPNGGGKTTTINIIAGFMHLDSGEIIFSDNLKPQDISIVFGGDKNLYMKNTAEENIYYLCMMKGLSKKEISQNINRFQYLIPNYDKIKNTVCEKLSHGQKRLVSILIAMASNSKVIILDESTEGLDQNHIDILTKVLVDIKDEKIIILCSQDYDFVDSIADKIYFLKNHEFIIRNQKSKLRDEFIMNFGG